MSVPLETASFAERLTNAKVEASIAWHHWFHQCAKMEAERNAARMRVEELEKEVQHWKANHYEQKRAKQALLDRPDLGDRSKRVTRLIEENEILRGELNQFKGAL